MPLSRSETMRRIRRRDTEPELRLRALLRRMGLARRYRIDARPRGFAAARADALVPCSQLAIFVHGCFWHGCPEHFRLPKTNTEGWRRKIEATRERDARDLERYRKHGWGTAVLWECEDDEIWERKVRCVLYDCGH